ncbi:MAG TPA: hypothetical protein VK212_09755 [Lentimicrobium sp.]|nr:hypothetical protein [Lentimicrobium sp.]
MKKILIFSAMLLLALMVNAKNFTANYVITDDNTYFCDKVRIGLFNTKVITSDGATIKIPNKEVSSYMTDGRYFERLPLLSSGKIVNTSLLEFVAARNGLRLYKLCHFGECGDLSANNYKKAHQQVEYYVYKDGEFYLNVDQRNAPTVLPFFGIKII